MSPRRLTPLSPLSKIRIDNVRKLLVMHDLSQAQLATGCGLTSGRLRQSFGETSTTVNPSELTMNAICTYFKLWSGALDIRDFDPNVAAPPGIDVTIHIKNMDRKTAARMKQLVQLIQEAI